MLGMYHRYQMGTKLAELLDVKITRPVNAKSRWKGIPHAWMVAGVLKVLEDMNCGTKGFRFHLSHNDADIAFSCNVIHKELKNSYTGMENKRGITLYPAFGFVASNAGRRRLTFYCGLSSPEPHCAFVGARWHGSSYTKAFSVGDEMRFAYDKWEEEYQKVYRRLSTQKKSDNCFDSDKELDCFLIKAVELGLIPRTRVARVVDSMRVKRKTRARVLFAFSEIVQMKSPKQQMDLMFEFLSVIDKSKQE